MKYKDVDWSKWPDKPDEDVYNDWLKVRKIHKACLTQTAINRMATHINKLFDEQIATPTRAVEIAVENGWRGIKYAWVVNAIIRDMDGISSTPYFQTSESINGVRSTRNLSLEDEINDTKWAN